MNLKERKIIMINKKATIYDLYKSMYEVISLNFDWDKNKDLNYVSIAIDFLEEFNENPDKFLDTYREVNNNETNI